MKDWIDPQDIQVPPALQSAIGGHPLVAATLARRGITEVETARAFLDPDHYHPAPPTDLPNMVKAAERLERAIRQGETICVWGDFDADGQTSTTVLVSTLRDLGAVVRFHIPHRRKESHGVNLPVLKQIIADGAKLVLTCDTGVTAHEAIDYAQTQGVDVIVTDHHDLPPTLPQAHAVINPKMLPENHPLRELPGVGAAYKLAEALYERAGRAKDAIQHLDLVAIGIVADVATQTGDTRYLLQRGLEVLRRAKRLGLQVMMETAGIHPDRLTGEHIGFGLGPRLNALGRLDDATPAVEFLTTDDLARARVLATQMEGLNAQRKMLCNQITQAAEAQIERDPSLLEYGALVLNHPTWPPGVVGIVAGRLAERYNRPALLIATPPDEMGRGSARSVEGCDIHTAIAAHGEMLNRFGGHPMAAGLSIDPERIPEFRRALSRTVLEMREGVAEKPSLQIDGYLPLADLSLDLVEQLERLAPFGQGNPALTLATKGLVLKSHRTIGRTREHLRLVVEDGAGTTQTVLWWRGGGSPLPQGRFDLAYSVQASDYRGQREVQVVWVDAREKVQPAKVQISKPKIHIVDYRQETNPHQVLERLRTEKDVQVWAEAKARAEVTGQDRRELIPSQTLAIWTTPPGPNELQKTMKKVSPETIYLFGIDPGLDEPKKFLQRLAGLVKRALNADQGRARISTLAAATAQREESVRAGLGWLAGRGQITILDENGDEIKMAVGSQTISVDPSEIIAQLRVLLKEAKAYRAHFSRADPETLI
ncbi:MAG: single-stranded-DNA-specific exonuclease RecJ [Chloroflexi bacterium]|nr:single-stranded-DNA-specific exonuclease RecJ [Chloroflexota bacterium]